MNPRRDIRRAYPSRHFCTNNFVPPPPPPLATPSPPTKTASPAHRTQLGDPSSPLAVAVTPWTPALFSHPPRSFANSHQHTWYAPDPFHPALAPSRLTALCSVEGAHKASWAEKERCRRSRLCHCRRKVRKAAKGPESGVRDYEEERSRRIGPHPDFKDHQRSNQRQSQKAV